MPSFALVASELVINLIVWPSQNVMQYICRVSLWSDGLVDFDLRCSTILPTSSSSKTRLKVEKLNKKSTPPN